MKKPIIPEFKPGEVLSVGRHYNLDDCQVLGAAARRFWDSEGAELVSASTFLFNRYNEGNSRGTIQLGDYESVVLDRMNAIGLEIAKAVLGIDEVEPDIFAGVDFPRSQRGPEIDTQPTADDLDEVPLHNVYLITPLNLGGMTIRVSDDPQELWHERDGNGRIFEPLFHKDITLAYGETVAVHNMAPTTTQLPPRSIVYKPGLMSLVQDYPATSLPENILLASAYTTPGHIDF